MISAESPASERFLARYGGKVAWAAGAVLVMAVMWFATMEGF